MDKNRRSYRSEGLLKEPSDTGRRWGFSAVT